MVDQLKRYEIYAYYIKRMLLFVGIWPGSVSSKTFRFITVIHVLTSLITGVSIMNFVLNHIKNLSLATKGLSGALSIFTILLKIMVFTFNRKSLMELHETLETTFSQDLANPELRPILLSALKYFYHPALLLTLTTWATIVIYFFTPPISISIQKIKGISPIIYHLPFPSKFPWTDPENGLSYLIQYVVEILAGCAIAGITTSTDSLFGFYIFQMSSQLRTLSYRMVNLKATDEYQTVLKQCIQRYQILTHSRNNLERVYGPIVLWLLMTSAMIICALIFQASQMSFDKALLVLVYIVMKFTQTLMYGSYGSLLTFESEAFRESVYCSGWPDFRDKSFKSNIIIMLMNKPMVLTACHFSVISLDMFLAIINTALSYFFLLRTLDEGK